MQTLPHPQDLSEGSSIIIMPKISRWISTQKQYDNFAHVQLTFAHNGAFLVYNNGPIGHLLS